MSLNLLRFDMQGSLRHYLTTLFPCGATALGNCISMSSIACSLHAEALSIGVEYVVGVISLHACSHQVLLSRLVSLLQAMSLGFDTTNILEHTL